ncbi:MAG: ABC-three component system middle component 1 [Arcobacteraceae bacterium]
MLINLIDNFFQSNSFQKKVVEYKEYSCFLYNNEQSSDYFILLDKKDISYEDLIELQKNGISNLDASIKEKLELNEAYEKNTTLVLCMKEIQDSKIDNIINQLEEDKYLFKKNILTYSDSEVEHLLGLLDSKFSQEQVNKLVHQEKLFETFKTSSEDGYALLLRLIIKLPFLIYERQTIELENLSTKIEKDAKAENIEKLYNSIVNLTIDVSQIKSYKSLLDINLVQEKKDEQI